MPAGVREHHPERVKSTAGGERRVDEAELDRPLDRLAPTGGIELPVDRDRLGLHGVARDEQPLGDLAEREVRRQQGQQPELGRGQRRRPARRLLGDARFASQILRLGTSVPSSSVDEGCRLPPAGASPRRVGRRGPDAPSQARAEPALRTRTERASSSGAVRWALTSVCRARAPCPFAIATLAFTASRIAVTTYSGEGASSTKAPARASSDSAPTRSPRSSARSARSEQRHDAGPDRSSGDGRLRRLIQERLRSVGVPREHARPPRAEGARRRARARRRQAGHRELCVELHLLDAVSAKQGADRRHPGLEGAPIGHRDPRTEEVSTASAQRSAASGRPRKAWIQTPNTPIAGYRSSSAGSSNIASQRSNVVTRPLR